MKFLKIGQYTPQKQIALGGEAIIFHSIKNSQSFAIKVYHRNDENYKHIFSQQKSLLQSLNHPLILSPLQYRQDQTIITQNQQLIKKNVVIMKYMRNGDLMDYINKNGRIQEEVIRSIVRSLFQCLKYIAAQGVFHCDLKPENILLNERYEPILIDFGFIYFKALIKEKNFPKQQYYIAPQVKKGLPYTQKSEAFSLGVLIFVVSMRCLPFKQTKHTDPSYRLLLEGKHQLFWKHFEINSKLCLSQQLKNVIVNLIEPNPKRRWSYNDLDQSKWLNQEVLSQSQYFEYFQVRQAEKRKNQKLGQDFPFTDYEETASKYMGEQSNSQEKLYN